MTSSVEANREGSSTCRALWLAVLLQAKEDVEKEPMDSIEYHEARAFWIDGGFWTAARANIGACLEMDGEVIAGIGRKWVNARLKAEGLPLLPAASRKGVPIKVSRIAPRRLVALAAPPPLVGRKRNYGKFWPRRL
jgi:hypothetical protein